MDHLYQVWLKLACRFWKTFFFSNINTSEYGFLIVAPPDARGPRLEETWIYNIYQTLSCKYDLFWLSGSGEDFYGPHPILYFCDYLPFEEDLALNLNNLEFPLPNDDLYQV
jgi:hypothetical protein